MATAKTYTVNIEVIVTLPFTLSLTSKEAKAICADFIEEGQSWASQAESCIERAIDADLVNAIEEQITPAIHSDITSEIEGIAIKLEAVDIPMLEIGSCEVEAE